MSGKWSDAAFWKESKWRAAADALCGSVVPHTFISNVNDTSASIIHHRVLILFA
jgi:hypothetical protein